MNDDSLLVLCVSHRLPTTAKWRQLIILWFDRNYKLRMMRMFFFLQCVFKIIYKWKTQWGVCPAQTSRTASSLVIKHYSSPSTLLDGWTPCSVKTFFPHVSMMLVESNTLMQNVSHVEASGFVLSSLIYSSYSINLSLVSTFKNCDWLKALELQQMIIKQYLWLLLFITLPFSFPINHL